jgi:hypothetical protein
MMDQGGRAWVEHGGVVASQEALDEGQGVNLHVAAKAELYASDQLHHVGGQGAKQDQDQLSQKGKASYEIWIRKTI